MAGDPAELAYGHCLAVLGDPARAQETAAAALRRAGRARGLVLAHARYQALLAADVATPDPTEVALDAGDPAGVATALAATKPAVERSVLDVRNRTATDRAALGRALGATPTVAALRSADIAEEWDRDLDPAMLAVLGPGDCVELAALLADERLATVADLLAVAPTVGLHVADCESCRDRLRAMASVRTLFAPDPGPVPDEVRLAGRVSRRKRPSAVPPPVFGLTGADRARRGIPMAIAVAVAAAVLAVVVAAWPDRDNDERVQALTKLPSGASSLELGAARTTDKVATVPLGNATAENLEWTAEVSAPWAELRPPRGSIERNGSTDVVVALLPTAPEGDIRAKLTVRGSDGSSAVTELTWTVEREPEIAASATGCDVKVSVVEDGELRALTLHWRDTAEHDAPLAEGPDGYSAMLPPPAQGPITWWVAATDDRGNSARSADAVIQPGAC